MLSAAQFAARKHASQRRKGNSAEPYVNHLIEVARLLTELPATFDLNLVVAGFLHDTLEDTNATRTELVEHFGEDVTSLVEQVTDDKSLDRAVRKRLQIQNATLISARAQNLSTADKISNLRSTIADPPRGWTLERRREYFDWAKAVVDRFTGVDPMLKREFESVYSSFGPELDLQPQSLSAGSARV
ncbi:MAG: bifunctional (p)ppGpp synthetase/guanosine-3',5'-bis(diphosphate) 3'-pyrophosphohydrolase [Acidobacteria bacterium]|nr:bifunctional (p)ppGpp synthetase/guanosine-3',5'-bis(diphosphate) 3'-pyrophosphohydrolase [Acidobacteriota bacterium]